MKGDASPASAVRRQLSLQQRAVEQLRALAKPYRLRVQVDAEGFPLIPSRYGQIEWRLQSPRSDDLWATRVSVAGRRPGLPPRSWRIAEKSNVVWAGSAPGSARWKPRCKLSRSYLRPL